MTVILAIDTSSEKCSVTLVDTNSESKSLSLSEYAPRSHAQRLLPMVQELLGQSGLLLSDMDALAFGRGPGSFTGLRIASGFVQGLAFGQDLPVVPVSNLQALAVHVFLSHSEAQNCLVLIDARMDEVYWAVFTRGENAMPELLGSERVDKPEMVSELLQEQDEMPVIGNGLAYVDRMDAISRWPRIESGPEHPAHAIASLAVLAFADGLAVEAKD
ncbi:hypothetical protein A3744_24955, partial [Oleiphilus sp. HI0073]